MIFGTANLVIQADIALSAKRVKTLAVELGTHLHDIRGLEHIYMTQSEGLFGH